QNYPERYDRFYHAIKERFPDVVTIANVDAWGHDDPVWRNLLPVEIIDEHYYRSYQWMRNNYTKYDRRMRNFQIYNGEYAANAKGTYGRFGNMNSAVGEAIYMLGMERNSDICKMASFAPMFLGDHETRWAYDMIHFNSRGHFVTPSYYIQQMMAMNVGRQNLKWTETGNEIELDSVEGKDVTDRRRVYQAVSIDDEARVIYIKIANPNSVGTTVKLHLREAKATGGSVIRLGGGSGLDENTPENPDHVVPKESSLTTLDELDVPAHSMNIFKISYQ
ncbi:MAG: hypothetical protein I3J02_07770, partial [Prevotella sp.]|nr:hypothetical protein [Prevotella sp.]